MNNRRPTLRRGLAVVLASAGLSAGGASPAAAATTVSSNWAGYAATAPTFRRIAGTWTVPAATCTAGRRTYEASWVGLGGYSSNSSAIEQAGTEVVCDARGSAHYSTWYELYPQGSTAAGLAVKAGDTVAGSVSVRGTLVTMRLRNQTTGVTWDRTLRASSVDRSSAEWIVEAPSACSGAGYCDTLPLSNFGTTAFSAATATSAAGHTAAVASWNPTTLELAQGGGRGFSRLALTTGATPSALSADGSAFSVSYGEQQETAPQGPPRGPWGGVES